MRFSTLGVCLHAAERAGVAEAARFYIDGLGFATTVDLGWFVALRHPEHDTVEMCVVQNDHAATVSVRGPVRGVVLAFVVNDVDAECARLQDATGAAVELAPRDEPWGQRRAVILDPTGAGIELVQSIEPDPAWLAAHLAPPTTRPPTARNRDRVRGRRTPISTGDAPRHAGLPRRLPRNRARGVDADSGDALG